MVLPESVQSESHIAKWKRILAILKTINFQGASQTIANPPVIISSEIADDVQYDFNSLVNSNDYSEVIKDFQRDK